MTQSPTRKPLTLKDVMKRAQVLYLNNETGHVIFLSFALGIMASQMDKQDLGMMMQYLSNAEARQRGAADDQKGGIDTADGG
jgi:hypothetical protein